MPCLCAARASPVRAAAEAAAGVDASARPGPGHRGVRRGAARSTRLNWCARRRRRLICPLRAASACHGAASGLREPSLAPSLLASSSAQFREMRAWSLGKTTAAWTLSHSENIPSESLCLLLLQRWTWALRQRTGAPGKATVDCLCRHNQA